jgi:Flp pilus assembly protein TadB
MAQTKRKRRSKHRGTAAGTIEARGRTGRPPSAEEKKKQARLDARERRLNKPPSWRSSFNRAGLAAGLMFIFLLVTTKGKDRVVAAVGLALIALLIYVPASYYLERYMWRRRQRGRVQSR